MLIQRQNLNLSPLHCTLVQFELKRSRKRYLCKIDLSNFQHCSAALLAKVLLMKFCSGFYFMEENLRFEDQICILFFWKYWVLPWECSLPEGGIIRSAMTVLARIEIVAILVHPTTIHTHNETQWPTAACRCYFALRDVSCRQSWYLLTPSHPRVPRARVTILTASPVQTLVVKQVILKRPQGILKCQPPICLD